jgi:hypothetical protein
MENSYCHKSNSFGTEGFSSDNYMKYLNKLLIFLAFPIYASLRFTPSKKTVFLKSKSHFYKKASRHKRGQAAPMAGCLWDLLFFRA